MTAPTPSFEGMPTEIHNEIFIAFFGTLHQSLQPLIDSANAFLVFGDYRASMVYAISRTDPDVNRITIKDFDFRYLIDSLTSGHPYIDISHFIAERRSSLRRQKRTRCLRALHIDLVFGNGSRWNLQNFVDGLEFFREHNIFPHYTIFPPDTVRISAHKKLKAQAEMLDDIAGSNVGRCVAKKMGAISAGVLAGSEARKPVTLPP